ncbi:hypothetical protein GCM10009090_16440 [[Pseudomonas] boreopolis]|uniref:Phage holin T7 family, holin superfamily II n=1 Tax=Xanthomonas boreopolis TaxID=86183 RepID=A0A919F7N4_9XANT|nr:hypothetical protein GCM10009090_16440 [[Pseudomonas] boreopolis]
MQEQYAESVAAAAAKLSPPVTVVGVTILGYSLQDWVYVLTIIYTLMLMAHHVVSKWIPMWRNRRGS